METVAVELEFQPEKYDSNNPLMIVGKKKKGPKPVQNQPNVPKPLTRKQKKKLQNILAKKKKKINRAELLEKLSKVQAKPQELDYLTSTSSMQTHGIKRLLQENNVTATRRGKISNIKGCNTKKALKGILGDAAKKIKLDPNVIEPETSSSDSSSDEEYNCEESTTNDKNKIEVHDAAEIDKLTEEVNQTSGEDTVKETSSKDIAEETSDNAIVKVTSSEDQGNLPNEDKTSVSSVEKTVPVPAVFVPVDRLPEIQAAREALPIFCEEQSIMEAVRENPVVLIHGETGSGKTTQVPQFLYEGGYTQDDKLIGITEPRRIAAMSMASRVGIELNKTDVVSYHVRYENNVTDKTQIKFMTDGVLLKEIKRDFFLTRYSVIIIDEAHERSVFSDVLIGLLSRIVPIRNKRGKPLKLIIMSATMRVEDFTENPQLFKDPPILLKVSSRQYTVQVHFNIRTPDNYLEAAYNKVCKIHSQLPNGAILVFLTGEKEVERLCKMLRDTYPFKDEVYKSKNRKNSEQDTISSSNLKRRKKKTTQSDDSFCSLPSEINLDDYSAEPLDPEHVEHQMSEDDCEDESITVKESNSCQPLYTLPLYSVLSFQDQQKVFEPPPAGSRLCVVATNVAETSITIPGLKYVVDSGKVKTRVYNAHAGGISQFCITWTSKASSNQRAGRAGRTEGGHCYRLYSSAVFEHDLQDFSPPEIQKIPVDDVLLQMKALGISRVVGFPFPSPPDIEAVKAAERRLVLLGALEDLNKGKRYQDIKKWEFSAKATFLGKAMSLFPLSPRFAKMLVLSYKHQCVPYIIAIVSAMSVPEVFVRSDSESHEDSEIYKGVKKSIKSLMLGDIMVLLRAVALFEDSKKSQKFCLKNNVRYKAMIEIRKMRIQLIREMNHAFPNLCLPPDLNLEPPNEEQLEKLIKLVSVGFTDQVARIFPKDEMKLNKELKNAYKCLDLEEPVFIHPSSILFTELPRYIVYQEIVKTSKYYMKGVVEINPLWLPTCAPILCKFSDPLEKPPPVYDSEKDRIIGTMDITFGPWQWELPRANMEMPRGYLKYCWFGFYLLDGQVFEVFKEYKKFYLGSPSSILAQWARRLPRIQFMLEALVGKEVDSKSSLIEVWKEYPTFLLREFWEWLPQEKRFEVECKWPPKS